ncbi:MAG: ADOP family duplicated permease [Candidatus Acidiferrales bacterium]
MKFWQGWFSRKKWEHDLTEEMRFHLEQQTSANIARGMTFDEARRQALLQLGAVDGLKEECREQRRGFWLETMWTDVRYGIRMLRKDPGFTAVAVLTLALGIGANTAIFSVVNGVLLNPLPFPHAEQLVTLSESKPNFVTGSISYLNFRDWQRNNHTFSSMAISRSISFSLTGTGEAEQLGAELLSSDYFSLLGVTPMIGRMFDPGEDEVGAAPVALISAGLWKRKFGSSPEAVGRTITLDGGSFTIVGVIPANFDLLLRSFRNSEVYVPIGQWKNNFLLNRGAGLGIHGIGRLKPGVSIEQARADMDEVTRNLIAAYPDVNKGIGAAVFPLKQDMLGEVRPLLLLLLGAVCFVLLIACVNVANLLLARCTARAREFAIRTALGAGNGRLIRQLLTESILLGMAGGSLGLLLAVWGTRTALQHLPVTLPRAAGIGLDARVLIFTIVISVGVGIIFGFAPALKSLRPVLHDTLKESGRGGSGTRHRAQSVFVVVEMALTLVLLVGAGLMIRTLGRLWSQDSGFNPRNVLAFNLSPPPSLMNSNAETVRAFTRELDRRLAATPGVQAVSMTWAAVPMSGDDEHVFWLEGQPKPASQNEMNWAVKYVVAPDYLKVMEIPLQRGRFFTQQDNEHAPAVAVIDETLAKKYFGNGDPIGRRIHLLGNDVPTEIVGVVGHVNQWGLASDAQNLQAQLYLPCMQMPNDYTVLISNGTSAVVRFTGTAPGILASIRNTSRQMNREQVVYGEQTMEKILSDSISDRKFSMILLGTFAVLGLLLSSIGIYGVISYLVGQRTHEIGIRIALGAQRIDVLRLVLGGGAQLALMGVAIGIAAALGLTRLMSNLLYGVSATDPITFAGVAVVLITVAIAACYIPARRATRVDPMTALRYE